MSPSELTGTREATVIELIDPVEPRLVLDRVRAAAQSAGPLTLVLAGQLHLDRRTQEPYLALALSSPRTVRHTAVPWRRLAAAVEGAAGSVTALVDLVADPLAWRHVQRSPLSLGQDVGLYGRVTGPPKRGRTATPDYLNACLTLWGRKGRPEPAELHRLALACAGEEGVLAVSGAPTPRGGAAPAGSRVEEGVDVPVEEGVDAPAGESADAPFEDGLDSLYAILAAAHEGRHEQASEAAAVAHARTLDVDGRHAPETVLWMEVRAELAHLAADPVRSCAAWLTVAEARLDRGEECDAAEVEACVDRAHHQWHRIRSALEIVRLAPRLLELRRRVPGRRPGALADIRERTELRSSVRVLSVRPARSPESAVLLLNL
ncbi:hypothetical protein [Streptomyces sp. NPDC050848]|uniref:hypothetical protein n=1 Tax=Streptomyces sp. NPDC050848 TaxID=3155791 RepID=UPI0033F5578A